MTIYDPVRHEALLTAWYFELRSDPAEFANLFNESLRNLTELLWWAKHTVKLVFVADNAGLWGTAWVEPVLSGAFFGTWIRKDRRALPSAYAFVRHAQLAALETFPVLLGITKQSKLHDIHIAMGYELVGQVPALFDKSDAWVYKLTKESIDGRRKIQQQSKQRPQRTRRPLVQDGPAEIQHDPAGPPAIIGTDSASTADWWSAASPDPDDRPVDGRDETGLESGDGASPPKRRSRKRSGVKLRPEHSQRTGDSGTADGSERRP